MSYAPWARTAATFSAVIAAGLSTAGLSVLADAPLSDAMVEGALCAIVAWLTGQKGYGPSNRVTAVLRALRGTMSGPQVDTKKRAKPMDGILAAHSDITAASAALQRQTATISSTLTGKVLPGTRAHTAEWRSLLTEVQVFALEGHSHALRSLVWLTAVALGFQVASWMQSATNAAAFGTRFEAVAGVGSNLFGAAYAAACVFMFERVSAMAASARLQGRLDGRAHAEVVAFGARWMDWLLWSSAVLALLAGAGLTSVSFLQWVPLAFMSAGLSTLIFALVRLRLEDGNSSDTRSLWLVWPDAGACSPSERQAWIAVFDRLVNGWTQGPVTLLVPATLRMAGEHLLLASRLGRLSAIFPKHTVELVDWERVLPPPEQWRSLPVREWHPPPELMLPAVQQHVVRKDVVLVITHSAAELMTWCKASVLADRVLVWLGIERPEMASSPGTSVDWIPALDLGRTRLINAAAAILLDRCVVVNNSFTASDTHTERDWNAASGVALGPALRHEGPVYQAVFSPDGTRIVTVSSDRTARIWDAASGAALGPALRHEGPVNQVAFSPDGTHFVTASDDQTARVWDAASGIALGPALKHEGAVWQAAFSPDGTRIVTASRDGTARVWDTTSGAALGPVLRHKRSVWQAAFSPDGTRIVTASDDGTARVWDATSGAALGPALRHEGPVNQVAFSPDGKRIVTASDDSTGQVWNAGSGAVLGPELRHESAVIQAAFSPDGTRIVTASTDSTARVWDAASGAALGLVLRHEGWVRQAAFSPDGMRIVTASTDSTARVWDAASGAVLGPMLRHRDTVNQAAFSFDSRRIVTASSDGTARVWSAASGTAMGEAELSGITRVVR